MSKIFYTSDLHLGNTNIITYEDRPYKTVAKMNADLIYKWNAKVGRNDEVYVLGDFSFKGVQETISFLEQLNGQIHLVHGNHDAFLDKQSFREYLKDYGEGEKAPWIVDEGWYKKINDNGREVVLCHFPIMYWDGMDDRGAYHLYGHMHSRLNMQHPHKDAFNVGIDVNNYMPATLDELLNKRWLQTPTKEEKR